MNDIQNQLHQLYLVENKTRVEISEELNIPEWKVKRLLQKYNIKKPRFNYHPLLLDKNWLQDQYLIQNKSMKQIADELNHTEDVVSTMLRRYNLKQKSSGGGHYRLADKQWLLNQLQTKSQKELATYLECSKSCLERALKRHGISFHQRKKKSIKSLTEQALFEMKKTKSDTQIAQEYGLAQSTVSKLSTQYQISIRPCHSLYEQNIMQFLDDLKIDYICKDRSVLSPKELDFYLPDHNFAIEVDGLYWHNSSNKPKAYHQDKKLSCMTAGINLFSIWEHEFYQKHDLILNMMKYKLGKKVSHKIRASQCKIVQLTQKEYERFLEQYHIQGSCISSVRYGLVHNGTLVCCMGFSKPRFTKNHEWELIRFCSRHDTVVHGGMSKLFREFIKQHTPNSIVSYCNLRYHNGTSYEKLGFNLSHISEPSYFYYKQNKTLFEIKTRYQAQKHKLSGFLSKYDSSLSEHENMAMNGYHKVYDAGHAVYTICS